MNKETELRFRQLRWNSPWMLLAAPEGLFGIWCFLHQIWNGFSPLSCIFGGLLILISAPVWVSCLCVVTIGKTEVKCCLGPVTLRRMAVREVKTLSGAVVSIGRGRTCVESLIILSPKSPGKSSGYYNQKIILGYLPAGEGIWLYHTSERMERLAKLLPRAEKR